MKTFNNLVLIIIAAGTLFTSCRKDSPIAANNPAANPSSTSSISPDIRLAPPSSVTVNLWSASSATTSNPGDWQGGNLNPQDPLIPKHVYLDVHEVQMRRVGSSSWETLNTKTAMYDLIALMNGSTAIGGETFHGGIFVSDIRLVLDNNNSIVTGKGFQYHLNMPKNSNSIVIPMNKSLPDGEASNITIQFILDQCIEYKNNTYTLLPVVKVL